MIDKIFFWKKISVGIIIFISILAIVALFSSSAKGDSSNEIELNFSFTEPVITQWNVSNVTYHNVTMNETDTIGNVGVPMLPVKKLSILLPQKGIVKSINITHSNNISLGDSYNVTPGGLLTNQSEEQQNPYNETLFNSSIPYPTQSVKDLGIGYFRGYDIFMCHLYPVHYINDTGEIYFYEHMNLTITTNNLGSVSKFFRGLERDEILMKQLVDDYSMNYTYNSTSEPPDDSTIVKQDDQYIFVIITKKDFVNASRPCWHVREWKTFQDLADYKNSTGNITEIVTVEDILSDPAYYNTSADWGDGDHEIFNDTQCRIRNFIKHAHRSWGADYFLLGGDNSSLSGNEIIPVRKLWTKYPYDPNDAPDYLEIASDLYYACIDGTFNENKDNRWGDPCDGNVSGDFENPPNRYKYENGNDRVNDYYAEADIQQYETDFDVGLFTPSLNLSGYEWLTLKLESNKCYSGEVAKIRIYSNDSGTLFEEITITIKNGESTVIKDYYIADFKNREEVYVEFYYNNSYKPANKNVSWNIDEILINETDVATNIFLFEDFEDPWVENEDEDLVPAYGWSQKRYNEAEGRWTKEHYREDVDLVGDVWIGRTPVGNIFEVSNFVCKTLEYEEIRNHDPFVKHLLLIGGRLNVVDWGKDDCLRVRNLTPEIYYSPYGVLFDDEDGNYSNKRLKRLLNRDHHLIFNMDHGYWNGIYNCELTPKPRYRNRNVCFLCNIKPFFWYSGSCLTGKFNHILDCFAEYLTVNRKHGAFAVIMNAHYSWNGIEIDDGMTLEEWFYYLMFTGEENPIHEIGKAHQLSRNKAGEIISSNKYRETKERINVYSLNLLGDPTLSIKIPVENHAPKPLDPDNDIIHDFIWGNSITGYLYNFSVRTTDPDGDKIQYQFEVNFSKYNIKYKTLWRGNYNSSEWANILLWLPPTINEVKVRARDVYLTKKSDWSDPEDNLTVSFDSYIQTDTSTIVLEEEIQFSGQASGGNEPYTTWYYDFGDGNYSQQQNTSHTYSSPGDYTITLNVNDSQNISSNVSKVIHVVLLNSDFESSPGTAILNLQETFHFNDTSKGYYDIVNWSWDFGDGNTSYQRNTSHEYSSYGEYNVTLTVTDNESNNDTFYQMIYIDSVPPTISSVSSNLDFVGYGCSVIISVNTSDNSCGIQTVNVNITYPDSSYGNYTMNNTVGSNYEYVFSDCWQLGEYSYIVWVVDQAGNQGGSSPETFTVFRNFGYRKIGGSNQTIWDTITGSVFRVNEKGVVDNISVYLDPGNATSDYHYSCVIYYNDSVLVGVSEEKNISSGKGWQTFNFSVPKPVLLNDTDYVIGCWSNNSSMRMYYDDGDGIEEYYDDGNSTLQGHYFEGVYGYTPDIMNFDHEDRIYSIYCCYTPDNSPPKITNVSETPDHVGFGFNVTITADVAENQSGIDILKVNITYPNSTLYSFTMDYVVNDTYEYIFKDTWQKGEYSYMIWTVDYMNNSNSSSGYSFTVSGQATVSVCTIKDEYGGNETVNLTDPPGDPTLIGYELLDDGNVLRIWNKYNNYYFDTGSGIQLSNHYDEYWSHNVLMLGYYYNDVWNLIYRTDELSGFNKDIDSDNETFVNATLWNDLTYGGYDVRLAIRYHLGVDDYDLTVIPYIKNIDDEDIPYTLGFGWELKDIKIANVNSDNYLRIFNGTSWENIPLSQTVDKVFTDMDHNTTIRLICTNPPTYHLSRDLYLSWDENLTYKVTCKSRTGQYNAPVTLFIKVGTLSAGQEKYTSMHWLDSDDWIGISSSELDSCCGNCCGEGPTLENALDGILSWQHEATETHWFILDLGQTYTVKKVRGRSDTNVDPTSVNVYVSDSKTSWGTAVATVISTWKDIPIWQEVDTTDKNGRYVKVEIDATEDTKFNYIEFGGYDPSFTIFDVYGDIPEQTPVIGYSYPANNSTGVSISPLLNITVSDPNGDNMDVSWLSNSSGSWQEFGVNNSVGNGTYHQTMVNASVNGWWWYWRVNVSDGTHYVLSNVYRFFTGYESKIVNTGSTAIKGYLLIQVQYYNEVSESWVGASDTINESSPRAIPWDDPYNFTEPNLLALDTIFNGKVNTSYLIPCFGTGTYRVYAAFRDPDGDVLVCDDQSLMEDSYQFTVSTS
jgi:PKD repeat protein